MRGRRARRRERPTQYGWSEMLDRVLRNLDGRDERRRFFLRFLRCWKRWQPRRDSR